MRREEGKQFSCNWCDEVFFAWGELPKTAVSPVPGDGEIRQGLSVRGAKWKPREKRTRPTSLHHIMHDRRSDEERSRIPRSNLVTQEWEQPPTVRIRAIGQRRW